MVSGGGNMDKLLPKLLVVDDNNDNLLVFTAYLNDSFQLDTATNGADALQKMQSDNYDLVVMDVKMSVMDGNTATKLYREWEKITNSERTPILTISASAFDYNEQDSVDAGCDIFLTKPIGKKRLLESINKLIKNKN